MSRDSKKKPYFLCDNPIIKLPQYKGDTVATMHLNRIKHSDAVLLPCGKCDHCLEKKSKEWGHRMQIESKLWTAMAYVTLTFDDKKSEIKTDPSLRKYEIQNFIKRLRKSLNGRKIRYFAVGEYGPKHLRKHFHLILYNVDGLDVHDNFTRLKKKLPIIPGNSDWHKIHEAWELGYSRIEVPRGGAFHYLSGYVAKISKRKEQIEKAGLEPEFRLMSKGLGKGIIERYARLIKQKKKPRPALPLQHFEYRYADKKTGKTKIIKRGLGRYLKNLLHEQIGMKSIMDMWNKLHAESIWLEYGAAGILMQDHLYLNMSEDERKFANFKRMVKDTYG